MTRKQNDILSVCAEFQENLFIGCPDVRGGRAEILIGNDASSFVVTVWRRIL